MAEPVQGNAGAAAPAGSADNGAQQPGNVDVLNSAFAGAEGAKPQPKPAEGNGAGGDAGAGSGEVKLAPWAEQLPEDLRGNPEAAGKLAQFAKLGDMAKAYLDLAGKQSEGIAIPGKDAKPEEVAAFWEKVGRPKTAEEYSFAKEQGAEAYAAAAHSANLTQAQAEALYKNLGDIAAKNIQAAQAEQLRQRQDTRAAMQKEYGSRYGEKIEILKRGLATAGPNVGALLAQAGLSGNPEIVKAFITFGELTAESGASRGGEAGQPLKSIKEGGMWDYKTT